MLTVYLLRSGRYFYMSGEVLHSKWVIIMILIAFIIALSLYLNVLYMRIEGS